MLESLLLIYLLMKEHGKVGECPYPEVIQLVEENDGRESKVVIGGDFTNNFRPWNVTL